MIEKIHMHLPGGSGPTLAVAVASLAYHFATEFVDRPRGRHNFVGYADFWSGYDAAVWWTRAGAVSVRVWRHKREEP